MRYLRRMAAETGGVIDLIAEGVVPVAVAWSPD